MKETRRRLEEHRPLAGGGSGLLAVLATASVSAVLAAPALATNLPFTEHIIATNNSGVRCVSAADVDGDGDIDVLSAIADDNTVAWYENNGASPPTFSEHILATDRRRPNFVLGTDIDGDGDIDILSSSSVDDKVAYYENDGNSPPAFTERVVTEDPDGNPGTDPQGFADGVRQVCAVDLDGDGDLDIGSASVNDDRVAWYENLGGSPPAWTPRALTDSLDGARAVHATDLDGDGDNDIIAGAWFGDQMLWFENMGDSPPTFIEHVVETFPVAKWPDEIAAIWRIVDADLDGDGDLDLLAARKFDGIEWYENDGGSPPSFTRRIVSTNALGGKSVYAADLDGDGDIDAMSASAVTDMIAWYENLGGTPPTFTQWIITEDPDGPGPHGGPLQGTADGARSVFGADLDGDGDTDIAWGAKFNSTVAWEENHLNEAKPTCPADLSGNGAVDPADLAILLGAWGTPGGDINDDGTTNATDLAILLTTWGPCP